MDLPHEFLSMMFRRFVVLHAAGLMHACPTKLFETLKTSQLVCPQWFTKFCRYAGYAFYARLCIGRSSRKLPATPCENRTIAAPVPLEAVPPKGAYRALGVKHRFTIKVSPHLPPGTRLTLLQHQQHAAAELPVNASPVGGYVGSGARSGTRHVGRQVLVEKGGQVGGGNRHPKAF